MTSADRRIVAAVNFDKVTQKISTTLARSKRRGQWAVLIATLPLLGYATNARAGNDTYIGTTGNWSDATKWSLNTPPASGDLVTLSPASGSVVVTLDISATNVGVLTLDASGSNFVTLSQTANLLYSGDEHIGYSGNGTFNQSGGTHTTDAAYFYIGELSGANGTYNLSNGSLSVTGTEYLGYTGNGTFNQSGGTHTAASLILGSDSDATGSYNLSNGTLSVFGSESVGYRGRGTFNQSGGQHLDRFLTIQRLGTYNLSNGAQLTVTIVEGNLGIFNQSGGSNAAGRLSITGIYNLGAGTLFVNGSELIGSSGTNFIAGILDQSGGSHSIGQSLFVGGGSSGNGAVTMTGGSLSMSAFGTNGLYLGFNANTNGTMTLSGGTASIIYQNIGYKGNGNFIQSGGAVNALHTYIGVAGAGNYTLSGGTLTNTGEQDIGGNGTGTFNQNGGTNSVQADLYLASNPGSFGSYTMSGGSLNVTSGLYVGHGGRGPGANFNDILPSGTNSAVGIFTQTGGISSVGNLYIGFGGISNVSGFGQGVGIYNLSNGASLTVTGGEFVGVSGYGTFNQTGGTHSITGTGTNGLYIGYNAGSSGTFALSGGTLTTGSFGANIGENAGANGTFLLSGGMLSSLGIDVGVFGTGTFIQTGGTNSSGTFVIGDGGAGNPIGSTTGHGLYVMSAGAFTVSADEYVGQYGVGTFNHGGGTHTVNNRLLIAFGPASNGSYSMSSGATLSVGQSEYIGYGGSGIFNQTGGSHFINGSNGLFLGYSAAGSGTYNLGGGVLRATNATEYVGYDGSGTFNQSGGTHSVRSLSIGVGSNGTGIYNLVAGTLNAGGISIGDAGNGSFRQFAGSVTTGSLTVGSLSTNIATYVMNGGVASADYTSIGGYTSGAFSQTGGMFTTKVLDVQGSDSAISSFSLTNGTLNTLQDIIGATDSATATFTQNGGSHSTDEILLGIVEPGLSGQGTYILNGGTLSTRLGEEIGDPAATMGSTFFQNGGTNTMAYMDLFGTYVLTNGVFKVRQLRMGQSNTGSNTLFDQRGGSASVDSLKVLSASYSISGGSLIVIGDLSVFSSFTDSMFTQTGGNSVVQGNIFVESSQQIFDAGRASVTLSGGTLSASSVFIGNGTGTTSGVAALIVSGGSLSVATQIQLYNTSGGSAVSGITINGGTVSTPSLVLPDWNRLTFNGGVLNLIGGKSSNTGNFTVGNNGGSAILNQSGGGSIVSIGGNLTLGGSIGPGGTYNLGDGGSIAILQNEVVGSSGTGTFNQNGGTHSAATLTVGEQNGSSGTFTLAAGTLTVGGDEVIGQHGNGVYMQTGGVNTIPAGSGFYLGRDIGLSGHGGGTATLSGGVMNVQLVDIGGHGTGKFTQSGGSLLLPQGLYVGDASAGTFMQTGGSATAANLYIGINPVLSTGTVNIQGGNLTVGNAYVGGYFTGPGGVGTLNVDSGTLIVSNSLTVWGGSGNQVNIMGGSVSAGSVTNSGNWLQTGGVSTLGALSGTGSATVGGAGTAAMSVANFTQNSIAINDGGTLTVAPGVVHNTNTVNTLTITGTGLLDLQNHHLLIDNTATPFATVKQYIDAAYHRNPVTGVGDYNGRGGITSSVVKANTDFMSVGYYNGALQDPANPDNIGQILGPNSNSGAGTGIPLSQILVRPTLTGDLNGDGVVNSYDVTLFNTFGLFGSSTNLGYQAGDLNGDGIVNAKDVTIFNTAGNFNNGSYLVAKAASTLTGHSASPSAVLNPSSGTLSFTYDPATGDVKVNYNGFTGFAGKQTFNTTTRALSLIDILSTGGAFALDATKLTAEAKAALSSPTITGNTEINLTAVNGYLPDGTDLGPILAPGLDLTQLAGALTLTFNYTGSRQLSGGVAGLIPITPEPTTLSLIGFGALGLLARRRRPARR